MLTFNNCKHLSKTVQLRLTHTWIKPDGFDTGIKIYNCITKSKEPFIIKNKHFLKWYTCGPTVYDSAHIGHASCYMKLDIIQRILKHYFNLNLVTVMNITDIDDKIIKRANEIKSNHQTLAQKYEKEFWDDISKLGISQPDIVIRVTEHISLIVDFIKRIEDSGLAYKAKDNSVYFDVESCKNYGKLQNFGKEELETKKSSIKKSVMDFALWKCSQEGEPSWDSHWGHGRPGWHIECSALASHLLGSSIDVHAGGIDLRFPHHENEEAQSCAYHDTSQWVNYWIHTGHLSKKDSEKMSKSLKNTISIQEMLEETSPEIFRMACLMSNYKSRMEYSKELMVTAKGTLEVFQNFIASCKGFRSGKLKASINPDILMAKLESSTRGIYDAYCDDFDTAKVLKILNELISVTNSMLYSTTSENSQANSVSCLVAVQKIVQDSLEIFGINFNEQVSHIQDFENIMDILNEFRQNVRTLGLSDKNVEVLKLCDSARDQLQKNGITVKDLKDISIWNKSI